MGPYLPTPKKDKEVENGENSKVRKALAFVLWNSIG